MAGDEVWIMNDLDQEGGPDRLSVIQEEAGGNTLVESRRALAK